MTLFNPVIKFKSQEAGGWSQEAGGRSQEAGGRSQEAGHGSRKARSWSLVSCGGVSHNFCHKEVMAPRFILTFRSMNCLILNTYFFSILYFQKCNYLMYPQIYDGDW